MKILVVAGIILLLANTTVVKTDTYWAWMFQAGIILLLGATAVFVAEKRPTTEYSVIWKTVGIASLGLMLLLSVWGFLNGIWDAHPLGFIIALTGCIWVFYLRSKSRKLLAQTS